MLKNLKKINFKKSLFYFSAFMLIFNASMFSAFFNSPDSQLKAENMCQVAVDVILIMDVSGSMEEGEAPNKCEWTQLDWVGTSFQCVEHTENNLTQEEECLAKPDPSQCSGSPIFTPATESKINNAKNAANSFLDNMGANDQSGLVSFSDNASLVKGLNNNHNDTKNSVNGLIAYGSTNIGEAINFATTELDNHQNGQAVKAMILLTDGKANEPNGDGYHENQQDVQYAIDQANLAGQKNYKIFTVGLGNDGEINESMLQQIANDTGANYHHAPNGTDLSDIYNDIAYEICQYGSISGCKYNDLNNNGTIDIGEPTIQNWQVALNNGTATTTQTISNGCYTFAGLTDNTYNVSETVPDGWIQTVPNNPNFYTVEILNHNNITDKDFANYYPECSNNILDAGEQCDDGNIIAGDGCSAICEIETPEPTYQCSDEIDNDGDQLIDYPNDPGCENLTDNDETNQHTFPTFELLAPNIKQHCCKS